MLQQIISAFTNIKFVNGLILHPSGDAQQITKERAYYWWFTIRDLLGRYFVPCPVPPPFDPIPKLSDSHNRLYRVYVYTLMRQLGFLRYDDDADVGPSTYDRAFYQSNVYGTDDEFDRKQVDSINDEISKALKNKDVADKLRAVFSQMSKIRPVVNEKSCFYTNAFDMTTGKCGNAKTPYFASGSIFTWTGNETTRAAPPKYDSAISDSRFATAMQQLAKLDPAVVAASVSGSKPTGKQSKAAQRLPSPKSAPPAESSDTVKNNSSSSSSSSSSSRSSSSSSRSSDASPPVLVEGSYAAKAAAAASHAAPVAAAPTIEQPKPRLPSYERTVKSDAVKAVQQRSPPSYESDARKAVKSEAAQPVAVKDEFPSLPEAEKEAPAPKPKPTPKQERKPKVPDQKKEQSAAAMKDELKQVYDNEQDL